ncbi:hypothetical protein FDP41_010745 [Naegleria fowleri]|uniref:Translation initiation factor eIF2B subunit alpha n=1 Tax=Naegleria fowleri TaxID=5763 RepID=A0A6A5C4U2_NAEFO|nr:uncharacterized protein FDP41_010745 [Naegleria fowleri]KAF0982766.1 hypothetical protein FDP41_010745 [Naegleria fowleri]CAG4716708.1 unnamed protein product [Naegleria fowleri]
MSHLQGNISTSNIVRSSSSGVMSMDDHSPVTNSPAGASPFPQSFPPCVDIRSKFHEMLKNNTTDLAVVGISLLTSVIEHSKASTMLEITHELNNATQEILRVARNDLKDFPHFFSSSITLRSACDIYQRFVTRQFLEIQDFGACKKRLTERGKYIQSLSAQSKESISELFRPFFCRDNMQIMLVGGYSEMIITILAYVTTHVNHQSAFRFKSVLVPEGRPDGSGYRIAQALSAYNIPITIITDASIAYHMSSSDLDFVLSGAEGVVESGGIINKIGTYQAAILAKEHKKPFYVAAESFKFVRQYPVNQQDLIEKMENGSIYYINQPEYKMIPALGFSDMTQEDVQNTLLNEKSVQISNPISDFTPPKYITMLFTDLGILTPSGVSDELIKLYS